MADFNIKFKYDGIGKQASVGRQKALNLSKQDKLNPAKNSLSSPDKSLTISTNKLISSITKLIDSNKHLAKAISGGGGGGGGGGGDSSPKGGSAGFGRIGASIPLLGAGIAALGFTIQKVNEIGNAYIEKTSQQIGNVGVGGFRFGQGTYRAAEVGAGMKAYGMATGRFISPKEEVNKFALDVGSVYGLSAEEALGTAGKFKRANANYEQAANVGAGMGIQAELPILLNGMASTLEEAIKNGVDASNMGKDMAKSLAELTMNTPAKSVDAALNIVKGFSGVKSGLERGKMGGLEGLYGAKATRNILMEKITGKGGTDYLEKALQSGYITEEQKKKALQLGPGASYQDLQRTMGAMGSHTLLKKTAEETNPAQLVIKTMQEVQKQYGTGATGFQQFSTINAGGSFKQSQLQALWQSAQGKEAASDVEDIGKGIISKQAGKVRGSAAGFGVRRDIMRENVVFKYGASFAKASFEMEKAMINVASTAIPIATKGITALGTAATNLATKLDSLIKMLGSPKSSAPSNILNFIMGP
jgi:hypothetical protein